MTGHRQPWYLDRLRAELERVAAIEDRRERGPALGRLRPALGRLRPWPQTLVALALIAALVAVVVTTDGDVVQLLQRLPADQRAAIEARVLDEQESEQIAAATHTSEAVIRKRVSRGLASLRRKLEGP